MSLPADVDADFVSMLGYIKSRDDLQVADLPRERAQMRELAPAPSPEVQHDECQVPRRNGDASVRVVVSRPQGDVDAALPCIVWVHGGGYMLGAPEMDQARIDGWAADHRCIVVSPDYRLAPDHPYPAGVHDCHDVLRWCVDGSDDVAIDSSRVVLAGMSAGGGLAAATALLDRDTGGRRVTGLMLLCPMLDDRFDDYPSSRMSVPGWGSKANRLGWQSYLGRGPGSAGVGAHEAAARATDLRGLPRTFVGVAGLDVLRDEALRFAQRLVESDVPVDLHLHSGVPHGFSAVAPDARHSVLLESAASLFLQRCLS